MRGRIGSATSSELQDRLCHEDTKHGQEVCHSSNEEVFDRVSLGFGNATEANVRSLENTNRFPADVPMWFTFQSPRIVSESEGCSSGVALRLRYTFV